MQKNLAKLLYIEYHNYMQNNKFVQVFKESGNNLKGVIDNGRESQSLQFCIHKT